MTLEARRRTLLKATGIGVSAAAAVAMGATAAAAATGGPYSDTITTRLTNFTSGTNSVPYLNITRFDPALGTLTSVTCTLSGTVSGSDGYENVGDSAATNITLDLKAQITVSRPGGGQLGVVLPLAEQSVNNVPPYDGTEDFGGTSGQTFNGLTNTQTANFTLTAAADLATFTGTAGNPGTVALPATATGQSVGTGNGNVDYRFRTSASATVTCSYSFTPKADLQLTKTLTGTLSPGGTASYSLAVKNNGPSATEGTVTVKDTLPTGLTYNAGGTSGGNGFTCSAAGQVVTCTSTTVIANGATSTLAIPVNVTAASGTSITNSATVSDTAVVDGTPSNDTGSVTSTVSGFDLTLAKTSPALRQGVNATYVLTAKNNGPSATSGTTKIVDTLPAGLTYVSATGTTWTCTVAGQVVTCTYTGAAVAPGATFPTVSIVATPTTAGQSVTNTATVSNPAESNTGNDGASSTATTVAPSSDLAVTKTVGVLNAGQTGTFTVAVKNNGPGATAGTTTVTDTLPAGLTYNATGSGGAGFTCAVNGQVVTCTSTTAINNGATATFPINVTVAGNAANGNNTATVDNPNDGNAANNSSTVAYTVVKHSDLAITKTVVTKAGGNLPAGGTGSYTLAVVNNGPSPVTGTTVVTDTLPAGLSLVSAAGTGWTCTGTTTVSCTTTAAVASGAAFPVITLTVNVTAAPGTAVTNTASVANTTSGDTVAGNDSDGDTTTVARVTDLSVVKTSPGLAVGGAGSYSLAVGNAGPSATTGTTTVTDTLPAGLSFVAAGSGGGGFTCTAAGQTVTCTSTAALASGYTGAVTLNVTVSAATTGAVSNTATVSGGGGTDPVAGNNSSTVTTTPAPRFDLALNKTGPATAAAGSTVAYTLAVTNNGPSATSGTTTVKDTLPAGLTYVSATGTGWTCAAAGQVVTCTSTTVVASGAAFPVLTLTVSSTGTTTGAQTDSAVVSTSVAGADTVAGNNTDTAATTFAPSTELTLTKTAGAAFVAGGTGTYTLTVRNNGPSTTAGTTTVTDTLPAGLTYVSATGTGWTCSANGQLVTCTTTAAIANGASYPAITLTVNVLASAPASVTNTATAANPNDPTPGNDSGSATTPVSSTFDLTVAKTATALVAGTNGTYTITVRNNGPSATAGTTTVTDTLPAGLTYVSATGTGWTCSFATGTVTCTSPTVVASGANAGPITLVVAVAGTQTANVTNTATVANPNEGVTTNNSGAVTSPVAVRTDLTIAKTGTGNLVAGQNGTYALTVTNTGPSTTRGTTTVNDTLPAGLTYVSATGTGWTCTVTNGVVSCTTTAAVASGAAFPAITLTVAVSPTAAGSISNTATVANGDDPDTTDNSSTLARPVTVTTSLTVTKTTTGLRAGQAGTYTVSVANAGPAATSGTTQVVDTLPAGITYVSGTGTGWSCSVNGQVVTCSSTAAVAAGASFPALTLAVTAGAATGGTTVVNNATVSTPTDPSNGATSLSTVVAPSTDLSISKTAVGAFVPGQNATYTLVVTNAGPSTTAGTTTVTDTLPAGLTFVSGTGTGWTCSAAAGVVTCTSTAAVANGAAFPTITLTALVGATQTGTVVNSATVANPNDVNGANNGSGNVTTTLTPSFDLTLAKAGPATAVAGGANVTYTLTATNAGPSATSGTTTVTDTLPAGLTRVSSTGTGWTCTAAGQTITCTTTAVVAPGAAFPVITVVASSAPTLTGTVVNTATVSSSVAGANPANGDTATAGTTVTRSTDLSVTKTLGTPLRAGQNDTYTITVTNNGPSTTGGTTTVNDPLPAGLTYVSATGTGWTCSVTNGTVSCTTTQAVAGGAAFSPVTLTVAVGAGAGGQTVTNTATVVSPNDGNGANNTGTASSTVSANFDLTVAKTSPATFTAGTNGTYTVTVTNAGPSPSAGTTTVVDTLPVGLTLVSATGTGWTCSGTTTVTCTTTQVVAGGAAFTPITVVVAVASNLTAPVTNTATVANPNETDTTNDAAQVTTNVVVSTDLSVTKTTTGLTAGSAATYVVRVTNNGPSTTRGSTTVSDAVPTGLTPTAATGTGWQCTVTGQSVVCTSTSAIAPGAAFPQITVTVAVAPTATGSFVNTAQVSNGDDTVAGNNTGSATSTVTLVNDLSVVKSSTGLVAGQNGTYTITVTNNGPSTTSTVTTVTDTLPAGLTLVSTSGAGWTCTGTTTISCTSSGSVAAGGAYPVLTVTVAVAAGQTAAVSNTATVANVNDPTAGNNTSTFTTTPGRSVDLSLAKTAAGPFTAGQNGTYTLTVTNNGPSATTGQITVVDTLPAGLTYVAAGSGNGTWACTVSGQQVTCTSTTTVAAGATSAFPLVVAVAGTTGASVANSATVSGSGDTTPGNNTATTSTPVTPVSDLTVAVTGPATASAGATVTYTVTPRNNGPSPTSGSTTVTVTLPAGLTYVSSTVAGYSCTQSGQTLTCTSTAVVPAGGTFPAITVTASTSPTLTGAVTVGATVADPQDANGANNAASTSTTFALATDLTLAKTSSAFTAGQNATYTLTVTNNGPSTTAGVTTVTDTVPAGVTVVGTPTGTGWACSVSGTTVTCTTSAAVPAGAAFPAITVTVAVAPGQTAAVTNTASVANGNDPTPGNNTGSVTTTPGQAVNLSVTKTGPATLPAGGTGSYTVTVTNRGPSATTSTVTVTDALPAGLTPTAASGTGWTCSISGQNVSCTSTTSLALNATSTPITLTVAVAGAQTAAVTNTATVVYPGDTNAADNTSSVTSTISVVTDVTVTKTASTLVAGTNGSYTLAVGNAGPATTRGTTTVTDTLPAGLTYVSSSGAGWLCSATGQTVSCSTTAAVAAGGTFPVLVLTVAVAPTQTAAVTNTATITNPDDPTPGTATTGPVAVAVRTDLTVAKTAGTLVPGQNGTYTVTVSNAGPSSTSGSTVVNDTLPAGLTYVGSAGTGWACTVSGQAVQCTSTAVVAAGATYPALTLTVAVAPGVTGTVSNTVTVTNPNDPTPGNNSGTVSTTPVAASDLTISKTTAGSFVAGSNANTYTVTVTNLGPSTSGGSTQVTDTLPTGETFVSGGNATWSCAANGQNITCTTTTTIAPNAASSFPIVVSVTPTRVSDLVNTATVVNAGDPNGANNSSTATTPVVAQNDLSITKAGPTSFVAGTNGTYTLTVANAGPSTTRGTTTVTDTLPAGLTYRTTGSGGNGWACSASGQLVTCTTSQAVAAGGTYAPLPIVVGVGQTVTGSVSNTATVQEADDPTPGNNTSAPATVTPVSVVTDLAVAVTSSPFTSGSPATYTITVTNNGPSAAVGPRTVTDTLPAGVTYVGSASSPAYTCAVVGGTPATGQTVRCTVNQDLASGASLPPLVLDVTVDTTGTAPLSDTATVDQPAGDTVPGNNTATTSTTAGQAIDLSLTKTGPATVTAGAQAVYTLTVTDNGPTASTGLVTVTDTLPAGLTFVSGTGTGWTCSASGQTVTCTTSQTVLATDGTSTGLFPAITLTVAVRATLTGTVGNSATVTGSSDPTAGNNTGTTSATVVTSTTLTVTKTAATTVVAGNVLTYTVTVTNTGPSTTNAAITVTDTLPAGLTYLSSSGGGFTCTANGQALSCSSTSAVPTNGSLVLTIRTRVSADQTAGLSNTAAVTGGQTTNPTSATSTAATTSVTQTNDLSITKAASGSFSVGVDGTYTLTVTNLGPSSTQTPVTVSDTLPAGLTYRSASGAGFACSAAGAVVTCTRTSSLAVNAPVAITLVVGVGPAAVGQTTNTATVSGGSNDTNTVNNSSSATVTVVAGGLGDRVFVDANGNGLQDAGEGPAQGVIVTLYASGGTAPLATATTDANGLYLFPGLAAGTYDVVFSNLPAGYGFTKAGVGGDRTVDSDPAPATGRANGFVVTDGAVNRTADAGLVRVDSSISGRVFEDANNDGAATGDPGVSGATVTLTGTDDLGAPVRVVLTTGTDGSYSFLNLRPGTYTVTETQPTGYLDGTDRAGSAGGTAGDDVVSAITLAPAGTVATGYTFGELAPASLGNRVFLDGNDNGVQDAGENGVDGITVSLFVTGSTTALATQTTAGGGLYLFTGLLPGSYTVVFGPAPTGFAYTAATRGGDPTADSDADPVTRAAPPVTLTEGQQNLTVDAGLVATTSVSGSVFVDADNDGVRSQTETGVARVTVTLTGTDDLGNAVSLVRSTGTDGSFAFLGLRPGTYSLAETQPTAYNDGQDALGTAGGTLGDDTATGFTLAPGVTATGYTFGELAPASLGDTVFLDVNGNGVYDPANGDTAVPGVVVTLTGTDDRGAAVTATATTGADGTYLFTGLRPGAYRVTFTLPDGRAFTRQDVGGDDSADSDADLATGTTGDRTLVSGQADLTLDAGLVRTGTVSGVVFTDLGNDGLQGAGDTGLDGVTVVLVGTDDTGATVTATTVTAGGGLYAFTGLRPGTYSVAEQQPTTRVDGIDTAGTRGGSTATDDVVSGIVLDSRTAASSVSTGNTFAELLPASLGDTVFSDTNGNGVRDGAEAGVAGVTVTVSGTTDRGQTFTSTPVVTAADGSYLVTGLRPGTYTVTFTTLPAGTAFTAEDAGGDDATDSDANPVTGTTGSYTLLAGGTNPTVDAGLVSATNRISGSVYEDLDDDGVQDAGEAPVAGVTVTLTGTTVNGTVVSTFVTTNAGGGFTFTGLQPGTYTVTETQPAGYLDGTDATTTGTAGNDTVTGVVLANGGSVAGITFGELLPATLGDVVFVDANGNGIQDATEAGLDGVVATLTGTDDLGTVATRTVTTAGGGVYLFTGLRPGSYTVTFGALPTGDAYTRTGAGTTATDSDANPVAGPTYGRAPAVTLVEGETNLTVDAGVVVLSSISGSVYVDSDDDGVEQPTSAPISGITITLTGTDALGSVTLTTTTDGDGNYTFAGLRPGTYTVTEGPVTGFLDGTDAAGTSGGSLSDDVVDGILLRAGVAATGYTFGELEYASIGDTVFLDVDGDGLQSPGDTPVAGVTVTLTGADDRGDTVTLTRTTGADGTYVFEQLRPGTYQVTFTTLPTGTTFTKQGTGAAPTTDSDADVVTGSSGDVVLTSGDDDRTIDAGLVRVGVVSGTVFTDLGNDGAQGAGDTGIAGVTVTLTGTDDLGAAVSLTATTAADGTFSFTGLRPGTYTVTETQPAGRVDGTDTAGTGGGSAAVDDVVSGIVLGSSTPASATSTGTTFAELLPASLGDTVFFDTNGNGVRDAGEPGVAGVTVTVTGTTDRGTVTSVPVQTDGNGRYLVTGLRPGTYTVTFTTLPSGTAFTVANTGDDTTDSDANPVTGSTGSYPLLAGGQDLTVDAGLVTTTNQVSGSVYVDANNNGQLDPGESPVAGVTVTLSGTTSAGAPVAPVSVVTNAGGGFTFTDLQPGTYTVTESQPAGYLEGGTTAGTGGGVTSPDAVTGLTLTNGGTVTGIAFGELRPTGLGNLVFRDTNANGVQDAGEPGVAGVTVTLRDASGAVVGTTTTDGNGLYSFGGLRPGAYTVTFSGLPEGLAFTRPGAGADRTVDSNPDRASGTTSTTLVEGVRDDTLDAGLVATTGSVSGSVFSDGDNDGVRGAGEAGIGGVTVVLTGTDDLGAIAPITVVTAADGTFTVPGLRPGTYTVTETKPTGYLDGTTAPASAGSTATGTTTTTTITDVVVTDGGGAATPTRAGTFGELLPASIGNRVFSDTNGNGVQDAGEPGVAGVKVTLTGTDDRGTVATRTVTTDGSGLYTFGALRPGTYTVTFGDLPTGTGFTRNAAGTDRTADSDAAPEPGTGFGSADPVTLAVGQINPDVDAGLVSVAGSISGVVVDDRNDNGVQDAGEIGLADVLVTLTGVDDLGNAVSRTVSTTTNGTYAFTGLRPGTYQVTESSQPGGFLDGTDTPGTSGGTAGSTQGGADTVTGIVLGATTATVTGVTFGELAPATIGDRVFADANGNGVQDAGETGVAGVTVTLKDGAGSVVATATTDATGAYAFAGLRPGTYAVTFTAPAGTAFTVADAGDDATDSDASPATGTTVGYPLVAGQTNSTVDAGLVGRTGTVSGTVYVDGNDNGVLDAGETPVAGVTVTLSGTTLTGAPVAGVTAVTDATGVFTFTGLAPGTYTVVESQPAGYLEGSTTTGTGSNGSTGGTASTDRVTNLTLTNGGTVTGIGFGELRPTAIGDVVFRDTNADGVREAGEPGVAGVTVTLTDAAGAFVASTTTVADGSYLFDGLRPGTYTVTFSNLPAGLAFTRAGAGTDRAVDSNPDVTTGAAPATSVAEGRPDLTVDAGLVATTGTVTGTVFSDGNDNGVRDAGETGIGGVTVVLTGTDDLGAPVTRQVLTNGDGLFVLIGLRPGTYTVTETNPAGFLDGVVTAVAPATVGAGSATTSVIGGVVVADGAAVVAGTFGEVVPASIGDRVFSDLNGNGVQDAGEPGVGGVTVTVRTAAGTVVATTTSASDGSYVFAGLRPGGYVVTFSALPVGSGFTRADVGGDDAVDSDASPVAGPGLGASPVVTVAAGQVLGTVDAGLVSVAGSVSGVVVDDRNDNGVRDAGENGIGGVTVTLTGTDDLGSAVSLSLTTGADGSFSFTGLRPGTYRVTESAQPTGYLDGTDTPGTSGGTAGVDTAGRDTVGAVTLGATTTTVTGITFGELAPATIGDRVFADANGNGVQDAGETGVAGVTVSLKDGAGSVVTTTTDATGAYAFTGLRPGTYTVTVDRTTLPTGTAFTLPGRGTDPSKDSDVAVLTGVAPDVTVTAGQQALGTDAGVIRLGTISGSTFVDGNNDGTKGPGDPGQVTTVTVTGTDDLGQTVSVTVPTNADGTFTVPGLRPSAPTGYTVTVTVPAGQLAGKPGAGTTGGTAGGTGSGSVTGIVLGPGTTAGTAPGGVTLPTLAPPGLSGAVYVDTNGNGIQDVGEAGIAGVTVVVTGRDDTGADVRLTLTTGADGSYSAPTLRPGTYTVTETQPAAYLDGTDRAGTAGGVTTGSAAGDRTSGIVLAPGTIAAGYTFGELPPGSVSGTVFDDRDDDGVRQAGEPGIGGVTLTLTGTDDRGAAVTATTTTGADGTYTFTGLRPGTYTVVETQPGTFLDGVDSAGSLGGTVAQPVAPSSRDADTISGLVLGVGGSGTGYTFGEVAPGTVTGVVFRDGNGNGTKDADEPGVRNVTVTLLGTDDRGNPVRATTVSATDGTYTFTGVRPGTYTVTYTDLPANTAPTRVPGGTGPGDNVTTVVNGVDTTRPVTVRPGTTTTSVAGGLVGLSCIKGLVYDDLNGNGVRDPGEPGRAGVVVILDGTDIYGRPVTVTLTTDATGAYSVCNIAPGEYTVTVGGTPSAPVFIDGNGNVNVNVGPTGIRNGSGTTPAAPSTQLPFTGAETHSLLSLAAGLLGLGLVTLLGGTVPARRHRRRAPAAA